MGHSKTGLWGSGRGGAQTPYCYFNQSAQLLRYVLRRTNTISLILRETAKLLKVKVERLLPTFLITKGIILLISILWQACNEQFSSK